MIDFSKLDQYRENNRIEAKKALGGLPRSIWETYSAFANTLGGLILLGVEEYRDKSLHTVDLPDPQGLIREFRTLVNDPRKASVNILTEENIRVENVDGDRIVVIEVPQAHRTDRPVYVDGDPVTGTYRRNGEGDHRCTREEYEAMVRDASAVTQDMRVLTAFSADVLCPDCVRRYRAQMRACRPGHVWEGLSDPDFLRALGALAEDKSGVLRPTGAGLLMFGREQEIRRAYPMYQLEYRTEPADGARWTERLLSASGDWSGNVFDFCTRVHAILTCELAGIPALQGGRALFAVREALVNSVVHADYYGRAGLLVSCSPERILFSNPGGFRVRVDAARSVGVSDPRNGALFRMFRLIDSDSRTGSGIPNIYNVWRQIGLSEPTIRQTQDPDRTVLTLPLTTAPQAYGAADGPEAAIRAAAQRDRLIEYLTDHADGSLAELAGVLELTPNAAKKRIYKLIAEGILTADGPEEDRVYRLKA